MQIGKYRILRQLAQGGMAEIFLATSMGIEGFEKLCVLKRILPLLATNQEFVQMFLDEARIAASLLHSNVAQVFDIGEDRGSYYFVMEFLRGEDVRHILQSSAKSKTFVPYEHMVSIITGTCAGLHYAHEKRGKDGMPLSLVHRDISPQNIFVTHDGNVKLCDFGIAKSAARLTETRVGTVKGKIRYMSPEQCQSEPLDRRSDVFALSVVMWELVALRRLFSGNSDFDVFKSILELPIPRPSQFRDDIHPGLEAIIMKGLERRREDRFQSAQEMQIALEDWARDERVRTSPIRLAEFMANHFPTVAAEDYVRGMTDSDPLAKRIRSLNENESSDSGMLRADQVEMPTRVDHSSASHRSARGLLGKQERTPTPSGGVSTESTMADDSISLTLAPTRNRMLPIALAISSTLLVAALLALTLRSGHPPAPAPPQPAPPAAVQPAPTPPPPTPPPAVTQPAPTPAKPTDEALKVPAVPAPGPAAPSPAQPAPQAVARPATPAKPVTPAASSAPAAKKNKVKRPSTGALDDFLPP